MQAPQYHLLEFAYNRGCLPAEGGLNPSQIGELRNSPPVRRPARIHIIGAPARLSNVSGVTRAVPLLLHVIIDPASLGKAEGCCYL